MAAKRLYSSAFIPAVDRLKLVQAGNPLMTGEPLEACPQVLKSWQKDRMRSSSKLAKQSRTVLDFQQLHDGLVAAFFNLQ